MASTGYILICPACGQTIKNVEPTLENQVQCESCLGTFVLRRKQSNRMPAVSGQAGIDPRPSSRGLPAVEPIDQLPLRPSNVRLTPVRGNPLPVAPTDRRPSNRRLTPAQPAPRPSSRGSGIQPAASPRGSGVQPAARGSGIQPAASPRGSGIQPAARPSNRNLTPASGSQRRTSARTSGLRPATAAQEAREAAEAESMETKSYSKQQIISVRYDRPERVPLGPAPLPAVYKMLTAVAWSTLGFVLVSGVWAFIGPRPAAIALSPASMTFSTILILVGRLLIALAMVCAVECVRRLDDKARWVAWRSASTENPLEVPPGSNLPVILPVSIGGAILVIFGIMTALKNDPAVADSVHALGGGLIIAAAGALVALIGVGSGEMRSFLWRMAQCGKSLPMRKRGDELGLVAPVRVQAFEQTSSALLMLLALAFLAAGFGTFMWSAYDVVKSYDGAHGASGMTLMNLAGLAFGGLTAILGGAYTIHRLATLWSDLTHGWESGARSVGKPRAPFFGERTTAAFRAAGWALGGAVIVLVVPVVKTVGNTSVHTMLLSIFLPAASVLFLWWLAALKMDSFRLVQATSVIAGPRALEAKDTTPFKVLGWSLMAIATIEAVWGFYTTYALLDKAWAVSAPAADRVVSVALLSGVVGVAMAVMPAFWAALTLMDLDRAAANLETCSEVVS